MAKKPAEQKPQEQEGEVTEAAPAEAPKAKALPPLPRVGDIVHFHRKQNTGNATKHETLAALVIGYPASGSNYQAKDLAVKLKIFTDHGDPIREAKYDADKKENCWGLRA